MKQLFTTCLRAFAFGVSLFAGMALLPASYAGMALFTGPGGTNPTTEQPPGIGTLNQLITAFNTQVGNYLTFNNSATEVGEIAINSSTAWAANGSTATSVTSVGPLNAHTTVQEWLVFMDPSGNQRFVPAF